MPYAWIWVGYVQALSGMGSEGWMHDRGIYPVYKAAETCMKKPPFILSLVRGQLGKKIVVKHYGDRVVITKAPDMSGIIPSEGQKQQRSLFAQAVAYAKHINDTPALKELYIKKARKHKSVYQYVLKQYLQKGGPPK